MPANSKTRVAVLFGGRSTEHEISIITALQVMEAFDSTRFEMIPVYVDGSGDWYTGEALRKRSNYMLTDETKKSLTKVVLTSDLNSELVEATPQKGLMGYKEAQRFPVDVFFPAFHGTFGEDGCIQGFFDFIGAAYVGCNHRAAANSMSKHIAKQLVSLADVRVLPDVQLDFHEWDPNNAHEIVQNVLQSLQLPVIVKPCNLGSSIAVSAAHTEEELMVSLAGAFTFDQQVIVEPMVQNMYELNCSVLEDNPPRLSAIERPVRDQNLLTFEEKYMRDDNKKIAGTAASEGMASLKRDLNPEDVPDEIKETVRDFSTRAFKALNLGGVVRIDYIVDKEENKVYFNEVNTLPGSFSYYLWEAAEPRLSFTELLTKLVENALKLKNNRAKIRQLTENRIFK